MQYPGGAYVNQLVAGDTRTLIVNNLETQLVAAGWSTISGGGTGDVVMRSAVTPTANNSIYIRMRDAAAANCAVINMRDSGGIQVSQNYYLLPAAAKQFRVTANRYTFACHTDGATVAREFVLCGTLWLPTWLHGVITAEFGFIVGNANTDTDTNFRESFRTSLHTYSAASGNAGHASGLCLANMMNLSASSSNRGMQIVQYWGPLGSADRDYRWHDDTLQAYDPLVSWSLTNPTLESKIRGMIWGAVIVSASLPGDTLYTNPFADGHNFISLTNTPTNPGTLLLAVS